MAQPLALYSAVDAALTHYEVDVEAATLTRKATIEVPSFVQYAWPHPTRRYLYVATSNRGPGLKADYNHVSAYRIDQASGALTPHGEARPLPHRAVHICVSPDGRFVVSAHNLPRTGLTVHRVNDDGTLGGQVEQPYLLDYGIYPHQVMVTPAGRSVIIVDRGNNASGAKPEDPGALRTYRFDDGLLSGPQVVSPNGGYGFGPRHIDFHPRAPWVYASLERQSTMQVFRMSGHQLEHEPAYAHDLLRDRANRKSRQMAGTVHVHPNGRYVYFANRADPTIEYQGRKVHAGGENTIVAFAIDQDTGAPTLIQHADTHSIHVRTFSIDPGGRLMVAASIQDRAIRDGDGVATLPAALSVFRIGGDGKLDFVRKYDVPTGRKTQYWMGIVG